MPPTVLIVDDDPPTQKLLEAVMRRSGLDAVIAPNGREAIDIIETRSDLGCIILDLMMPAVDGAAVIAHLTSTGRLIPVVVCTAVGPRQTPEFDPTLVRAVVRKPFDIEQLMNIVTAILG
ncbi:MAG: response regulator [Thermoanaerobaculia bacterium]